MTGDEDEVEDEPLDEAEEAAGSEVAAEDAEASLDEHVGAVIDQLVDVTRTHDGDADLLRVGGRMFAVVAADMLEVALDPQIAAAALRTPDTRPSPRGTGWIAFTPRTADRFALDRAEAWVRLAHRRAGDTAEGRSESNDPGRRTGVEGD